MDQYPGAPSASSPIPLVARQLGPIYDAIAYVGDVTEARGDVVYRSAHRRYRALTAYDRL